MVNDKGCGEILCAPADGCYRGRNLRARNGFEEHNPDANLGVGNSGLSAVSLLCSLSAYRFIRPS